MASLLNMSGSLLKKGSLLPSGYTQVEYIVNSDNSYIDTGIVCNDAYYEFEYKFKLRTGATTRYRRYFGGSYTRVQSTNNPYIAVGLQVYYRQTGNDALVFNPPLNVGSTYTMVLNNETFSINNKNYSLPQKTKREETSSMKIGQDATGVPITETMSFIIRHLGDVIWEGVPCISPNNVVGMYDIIGKQFIAAYGTYTAGSVVS